MPRPAAWLASQILDDSSSENWLAELAMVCRRRVSERTEDRQLRACERYRKHGARTRVFSTPASTNDSTFVKQPPQPVPASDRSLTSSMVFAPFEIKFRITFSLIA
jgi:hypothetical protein